MASAEKFQDVLNGRVREDIERYRKGYGKLRFTDQSGRPIVGKKVTVSQTSHDFGFGANLFMLDEFAEKRYNQKYREEFRKCFNLATVPFYWNDLEPKEGKPRFAKDSPKIYRRPAPDLCVEYCEENGITPKLHCLVYDKFIPNWLPREDMKAMEARYEERFAQIAERYTGRMKEFEVINELLCEPGWKNKSVISSKRDIIEWAFSLARKYFPNETLVINEGNPLNSLKASGYRSAYFMMVESALKSGAFTGTTAQTVEEYEKAVLRGDGMVGIMLNLQGLDTVAQLGLPLEMTEVTVPTFGDTPEDEELQADLLELLYTLWFSHPAMRDIVYWNLPDGYAFRDPKNPTWNENQCYGGLFHHDMTPKRAALRLQKLTHEIWHTEVEAETDRSGEVNFRGFYGTYTAKIGEQTVEFSLHSEENPVHFIAL